ncbi:Adhesion G protein-coupled receptor L3 [Amphibalanus amphitrite]|uniref:Adhesion G protein-coupled receptor L3 n=1 Tax=Amphibalanus amphitrite TaxID=1232801 RepID=A0A6A4VQT3_AMPAM|nr:Adhesion G protein-coupled receptor L3 [Amphibalanus amphitrite]KAF0293770.1 Adhesion G protein-coupled receptor L3 [Amphibalanus amphitrite]
MERHSSNITESDIIETVDQLDTIIDAQLNESYGLPPDERLDNDRQFTMDFVQLVDTLLRATDAWNNMTQSQMEETSTKLMASTEAAGFMLANSTAVAGYDDVIETSQASLTLSASSVNRNSSGGFRFPSESAASSWIWLPVGYAAQVAADLRSDRLAQVGVLYHTRLMELMLSPANNSMDDVGKRLNSPVLSFSLGDGDARVQLPGLMGAQLHLQYSLTEREPAQTEVWRHLHPGEEPSAVRGTAVCAYWNETLSEWRTDGCRLETSASSKHHASCVCEHLTSFAILMDYHEYVGTPESLNMLTWVLGSLSLRCTRTTITRHLCATYAVGLTLLLTVMDRRLVYLEPAACTVAGMAIHYSFLAVFAWTMVEGIHLYKVLRHVFEPRSNSMTRYYMYGYLLPALIIIVTNTVALAADQYAYVRDEFCWLTVPYFIWFYNGPIAVVLIMNMFVLILAYRSAASLKVNKLRAKKEKLKRWLKGWFSLSCLLGVQWAIGYIYVDGSSVFDYIFTALNCSQGLLIFIFHCVLREKTRQILLGRFSTAKRSTMMNSVYGQMVIAERKKQEYRQSRMSHDTCVTTLSNSASPANSESPDSSPASERSSSSSGSGSCKVSARSASRKGLPSLTRGFSSDTQTSSSSLRGRVNLAFQPDEPWAPLPDISEETDGAGSPRHGPVPVPGRGSQGARAHHPAHHDGVEIYRSHSVAALRHGKAH